MFLKWLSKRLLLTSSYCIGDAPTYFFAGALLLGVFIFYSLIYWFTGAALRFLEVSADISLYLNGP